MHSETLHKSAVCIVRVQVENNGTLFYFANIIRGLLSTHINLSVKGPDHMRDWFSSKSEKLYWSDKITTPYRVILEEWCVFLEVLVWRIVRKKI